MGRTACRLQGRQDGGICFAEPRLLSALLGGRGSAPLPELVQKLFEIVWKKHLTQQLN